MTIRCWVSLPTFVENNRRRRHSRQSALFYTRDAQARPGWSKQFSSPSIKLSFSSIIKVRESAYGVAVYLDEAPEFCSAIITDADDDPPRCEYRNCEKARAFSATSATCPGNLDDLESDVIAKLFSESLASRPFRENSSIFDGCKCYESDGRDKVWNVSFLCWYSGFVITVNSLSIFKNLSFFKKKVKKDVHALFLFLKVLFVCFILIFSFQFLNTFLIF